MSTSSTAVDATGLAPSNVIGSFHLGRTTLNADLDVGNPKF
jgi:hypothetical protein